jgi:hypothetical protein
VKGLMFNRVKIVFGNKTGRWLTCGGAHNNALTSMKPTMTVTTRRKSFLATS